jgi:hypothetical protein
MLGVHYRQRDMGEITQHDVGGTLQAKRHGEITQHDVGVTLQAKRHERNQPNTIVGVQAYSLKPHVGVPPAGLDAHARCDIFRARDGVPGHGVRHGAGKWVHHAQRAVAARAHL